MTDVLPAPAVAEISPATPRLIHRLRLLAVCLFLTLLAFVQSPGRTAADTKVDLTTNPWGFLGRALRLWDPSAAFGQLQNQATGYLFPMGPFFGLGHLLGLPGWVVQRCWWALLMVVAFLGFVRLAGRMGIGSSWARVLAGVAFAASPRVSSVLGATSVEALPLCLTPWVLIPLVDAAAGRVSARRGAARSGVAVLCVGGVNAVATLAALPVAALFLLCSVRGRTRRVLLGWWSLCVVLATLWWVVPLLLLGRYSPPFLSYIESSTVTTGFTSLPEAVRGTSHWVAFLSSGGAPLWPAAWRLVTDSVTILDTVLLAGLGLLGLARRDLPYRATLLPAVLLGLVLVTAGHVGPVDGPFAGHVRAALDGALAPFRNVHKFDAVIRLPLMLAACHALSRLSLPAVRLPGRLVPGEAVTAALAGVVVLGVVSPLVLGRAVPPGSWTELPSYWRQTADYLAGHHAEGRALLVPGSSFADYRWGRTGDEPLQALARSPWAVRNAIPLARPGTIRLLDAVQQRLAHGDGSPGLTEALQRSGVGFLVVRNDLDWSAARTPRPVLVHQALQDSPGIRRVAAFGPTVAAPSTPGFLPDAGLDLPYPAVEIYQVGDGGTRLDAVPAAGALQVAGGPEALLAAADQGLVQGRVTTLAGQPSVPGGSRQELVTDTLRRTEAPFGALPGDAATLAEDDPFRAQRGAHDYLPVRGVERQTVALPVGVRRVLSSSSGSDATDLVPAAQYSPYSAVDGSLRTFWHSAWIHHAVGQWLELRLARPVDVSTVQVAFASAGPLSDVTSVTVTTDRGSLTSPVGVANEVVSVPAIRGLTSRVRITVAGVRGGGSGTAVGVRELAVPGVSVSTTLVTPRPGPRATGTAYLLRDVPLATDGCVHVGDRPLCTSALVTPDTVDAPVDRLLDVVHASVYGVSVTARALSGPALDALVDQGRPLQVRASSRATPDAAGRPGAVVDRDVGTGWVAAALDEAPALELTWGGARTLDRLRLLVDPALAASHPQAVTVVAGGRRARVVVDPDGWVRFPRVRTDRLRLELDPARSRATRDDRTGEVDTLPVGVSELVVPGLEDLRRRVDRTAARTLACGQGPTVRVGGVVLSTRLTATVAGLLDGAELPTQTCAYGPVPLGAGRVRVVASASPVTRPVSVLLTDLRAPVPAAGGPARSAAPQRWDAEHRTVAVGAGPATVLVVHENANPGWHARLAGQALRPVVVDGWQQGWLLPAGEAGTVRLEYGPGATYRRGLLVGVLAVVALLALALMRARRPGGVPADVVLGVPPAVRVVCLGLLVLLGGPVGLGVLLVVGAVVRLLEARGRAPATGIVVAAVLGTAAVLATSPWPSGRGSQTALAQVLVLVALAAATWSEQARLPRHGPFRVGRAPGLGVRRGGS